jgi:signal transduction histidine kinase
VKLRRSIGFPLALGIVLTVLALGLAVGWQVLVLADLRPVARGLTTVHWLFLILGTLFFVLIVLGLVVLCAWLIREMRLNERQQSFVDAVTHELKTPLTSLQLYIDTLGRHDLDLERRSEFLGRMREDVQRLEHTLDQVLSAARADAGARGARSDPVDLGALLRRCVDEIRERHGLPAEAVRLEAEPAVVRGDENELALVFRNLLENAVKYSERPVRVRVAVRASGERRVAVEIADRGIGIPPRELRRIFDRFYRAGRDVQRKAVGLGLGLFIVRALVRRQGGRVRARSEGSGQGSSFVVTLRAARPAG